MGTSEFVQHGFIPRQTAPSQQRLGLFDGLAAQILVAKHPHSAVIFMSRYSADVLLPEPDSIRLNRACPGVANLMGPGQRLNHGRRMPHHVYHFGPRKQCPHIVQAKGMGWRMVDVERFALVPAS